MNTNIRNRIKTAIIRWALKPPVRLERDRIGCLNHGPLTIVLTPANLKGFSHDAVRAFNCAGYTYLFYKEVEEWKP